MIDSDKVKEVKDYKIEIDKRLEEEQEEYMKTDQYKDAEEKENGYDIESENIDQEDDEALVQIN